jgi:UDP-2,3-diacylglucosamine pyrophosphatase LpxH
MPAFVVVFSDARCASGPPPAHRGSFDVSEHAHFRTVFISDLHLGCADCRADDVADFLKVVRCDTLYLVGDVLDMWRLKKRWHWPEANNRVIRRILKMAKQGTRVVFIPGNHDEAARDYVSLNFGGVEILLDDVHVTAEGRRVLVTHGDQFDLVVTHARLLSMLGGWAYDRLLKLNRYYNTARAAFGYDYWSLSKYLKCKVKSACTFISKFENELAAEAVRRGVDGVVCGHIHVAEIRRSVAIDGVPTGVDYYNCGDWVEQSTALVEDHAGVISLIDGAALAREILERRRAAEAVIGSEPTTVEEETDDLPWVAASTGASRLTRRGLVVE